jgi:hypothetical protein
VEALLDFAGARAALEQRHVDFRQQAQQHGQGADPVAVVQGAGADQGGARRETLVPFELSMGCERRRS